MSIVKGINPVVAETLGKMGVDAKYREKKDREERPKMSPVVSELLRTQMGVHINEESPLDAPGSAPLAHSTGAQDKGNANNVQQPNTPAKSSGPVNVKLKDNAGGGNTLDDLSASMAKISESIRDMETLLQTLRKRGNDVRRHKPVLREYLTDIQAQIEPYLAMTK